MDPSLCTQPPEISGVNAHHVSTDGADKKERELKPKSNRQHTDERNVTQNQMTAGSASSAVCAVSRAGNTLKGSANAQDSANVDVIDLTVSVKRKKKEKTVHTEKIAKSTVRSSASSTAVTPTPLSKQSTSDSYNDVNLPPAPTLTAPETDGENKLQTKRLKIRHDMPRVSLDAASGSLKSDKKSSDRTTSETSGTRISLDPDVVTQKPSAPSNGKSTSVEKANKTSQTKQTKDTKTTKDGNKVSKKTSSSSSPPTKKKKRPFHDQILYTMLTSSRPYTLKSLAKECSTTPEALNHAMLSFLDKQLVITKDFPSKKGEKKLYWANPMTASEMGNSSAVAKELSKLLATPDEMVETTKLQRGLLQKLRSVENELNPLLAVPTLKQLDEDISQQENELQTIQSEIQAIRHRMEVATKPKPTIMTHNRFKKPPSKPRDKTSLKRSINHMTGEYKKRKRQCMDFVENLADAMEKKVRDATKLLDLETDEVEWGCWKDCGTGKIYGVKKNKGAAGEEDVRVRIPARYDV